jgi:hypothetical protein
MSDQDDWEFAGADDAKAEIRAAVGYLLRGAIVPPAVISCRKSFRSCAKLLPGCRPSSRTLWMMVCQADSAPQALIRAHCCRRRRAGCG